MTERTIELTRTIEAPPSTVFHALTDADELARWWTTSSSSEPRAGGAFSYRFEFEDATRDHTYEGAYLEVTPDERVSYPWHAAAGETTVDVRLRTRGEGTELTLRHTGWPEGADADEAVQLHEQGWSFFLDNLVAHLERGEDLRPGAPMGQKTPATV
ncbi:MAG: SRPBCC family protein [Gaiellaceae bacterium]